MKRTETATTKRKTRVRSVIETAGAVERERRKTPEMLKAERDCDVATVLAALRLWQRTYSARPVREIMREWPEHFGDKHPGHVQPVSDARIDRLCERINFGEVTL